MAFATNQLKTDDPFWLPHWSWRHQSSFVITFTVHKLLSSVVGRTFPPWVWQTSVFGIISLSVASSIVMVRFSESQWLFHRLLNFYLSTFLPMCRSEISLSLAISLPLALPIHCNLLQLWDNSRRMNTAQCITVCRGLSVVEWPGTNRLQLFCACTNSC